MRMDDRQSVSDSNKSFKDALKWAHPAVISRYPIDRDGLRSKIAESGFLTLNIAHLKNRTRWAESE